MCHLRTLMMSIPSGAATRVACSGRFSLFSVTIRWHVPPFMLSLPFFSSAWDHGHQCPAIPMFTSRNWCLLASGTGVTWMWGKGVGDWSKTLLPCPVCTSSPTAAAAPASVHGVLCRVPSPRGPFFCSFLQGPTATKGWRFCNIFLSNVGESCFSLVLQTLLQECWHPVPAAVPRHLHCPSLCPFICLLYLLGSLSHYFWDSDQRPHYSALALPHFIALLTGFIFLHSTFIITLRWSICLFIMCLVTSGWGPGLCFIYCLVPRTVPDVQ